MFGAGLLIDRPEVTDAAAFVDLLRATPGTAFSDVVFSDSLRDPELRPDVDAALDGDKEALDRIVACWPEEKHGWVRKLLDDPDALIQSLTERLAAWLPLLPGDGAPRSSRSSSATWSSAGGPGHDGLGRPDRAHDQRHPLAVRAGRPAGRARALVPRPPVQLHVQRRRLADVRLPGRGRAPSSRTTRSPRRSACCASTAPSATTAGSGSCAC